MLDHPILAGRIPPLNDDQDAGAALDQVALKLDQLDLEFAQTAPVTVFVVIGVRCRLVHFSLRNQGYSRCVGDKRARSAAPCSEHVRAATRAGCIV